MQPSAQALGRSRMRTSPEGAEETASADLTGRDASTTPQPSLRSARGSAQQDREWGAESTAVGEASPRAAEETNSKIDGGGKVQRSSVGQKAPDSG
jgi:hypothetical protein